MTTLMDGTPVEVAYEDMVGRLADAGYIWQGPDMWYHPTGLVLVTIGYARGQFRIRWTKLDERGRRHLDATYRSADIVSSEGIKTAINRIEQEAVQ